MTWRVGTKLGRTLYRDEVLVGMVDTPEIAVEIVAAMNADEARFAPKTCNGCGVSPVLTIEGACRRCGYGHK